MPGAFCFRKQTLSPAPQHHVNRTFAAVTAVGLADGRDRLAMIARSKPIEDLGADDAAGGGTIGRIDRARATRNSICTSLASSPKFWIVVVNSSVCPVVMSGLLRYRSTTAQFSALGRPTSMMAIWASF